MIRILILFAVLGAGLLAGTMFSGQQGYVLISIANSTLEMSVTTLVIFLVITMAALFAIEHIIKKIIETSSTTWNWFSVRKMRRSRRYTNEGIIKLLEGDWLGAEKKVTRWANHHDMPLLCYLIASEAAQGQGDKEKRNQYLALASKQENSYLAVELTRSKQLVRDGDYSEACETLQTLLEKYPNNTIALNLLKTTYQQLGMWQRLLDLLPKLKKSKQVDQEEHAQLLVVAHQGLINDIATQEGSDGVIQHWNGLSRKLKQNVELVGAFAKQLIERDADNAALTVLKETLKKHPSPELFALLPTLNMSDVHPIMTLLHGAISKDDTNAAAHSALASLYYRQEKWDETQEHLESALQVRSNVEDYALLADTLEQKGQTKAAHEVSRKALTLAKAE